MKKQEQEVEEKKRFASLSDREKASNVHLILKSMFFSNVISLIISFYYRELWPPRRGWQSKSLQLEPTSLMSRKVYRASFIHTSCMKHQRLSPCSFSSGDAGRVESLCLAKFHFSTGSIPSAPLAVSKHIEKPTPLLARPKEHLACAHTGKRSHSAHVNDRRIFKHFSSC